MKSVTSITVHAKNNIVSYPFDIGTCPVTIQRRERQRVSAMNDNTIITTASPCLRLSMVSNKQTKPMLRFTINKMVAKGLALLMDGYDNRTETKANREGAN